MPYKHQSESYRMINGKRWESWGDFNKDEATQEGYVLKRLGWNVRRVSIGGGMYRIFRSKP